jgi:hypothetical protein
VATFSLRLRRLVHVARPVVIAQRLHRRLGCKSSGISPTSSSSNVP